MAGAPNTVPAVTLLAVAPAVQGTAALAAALAAAAVLWIEDVRRRRPALVAAVVFAALALGLVIGGQVKDAVDGRLALLGGAVVAGLAALAAGAWIFRRWPGAIVLCAVAALPVRIPLTIGGETANLLLPLYGVIACGVVARVGLPRSAPPVRRGTGVELVERVLAGVVVLYAAQAIYSTDVEAAVKDICFFYVPFALLFRLLLDATWTPRLLRWAFGLTLGLALLCAGVGLYEYAARHLLLANEKVLTANELKPYFRVNSLFFDPNIYGRFLALAMVLVAGVLLWASQRRVVIGCALALAVLWAGLVPSLSESSFAALAVGLVVLAALRWRVKPVLLTAGVLVVAAAAAALAAPGSVGLGSRSFDDLNKATSGRADLIKGGLEMARDRPLAGFGSGSFAERYRARKHLLSPRSPAESHTIPVTVAAEQGIIGLAAYLLLVVLALRLQLRGARVSLPRAAVAAAFAALVVHTLVYAAFLEDPLTWALLAAAVALRRALPASAPDPAEAVPA